MRKRIEKLLIEYFDEKNNDEIRDRIFSDITDYFEKNSSLTLKTKITEQEIRDTLEIIKKYDLLQKISISYSNTKEYHNRGEEKFKLNSIYSYSEEMKKLNLYEQIRIILMITRFAGAIGRYKKKSDDNNFGFPIIPITANYKEEMERVKNTLMADNIEEYALVYGFSRNNCDRVQNIYHIEEHIEYAEKVFGLLNSENEKYSDDDKFKLIINVSKLSTDDFVKIMKLSFENNNCKVEISGEVSFKDYSIKIPN